MKTIKVRNGNEIIVSGDEIKPIIYNGDTLSLGTGSKVMLIKHLLESLADGSENSDKAFNSIGEHLEKQKWINDLDMLEKQ